MSRHGSRNTDPKMVVLMFMLMGGVLLFGAIMGLSSIIRFKNTEKSCSETTTGVVTDVTEEMRTRRRRRHTTIYYVYITDYTYTVNDVNWYSVSTLSKEERMDIGEELTVHYNPDEPDVNYTKYDDPGTSSAVGVVITSVLGVIFLIAGFTAKRRIALGGTGIGYGGLDGEAMDQLNGVHRLDSGSSVNRNNDLNTHSSFNTNNRYNNRSSYNTTNNNYSSYNANNSYSSHDDDFTQLN